MRIFIIAMDEPLYMPRIYKPIIKARSSEIIGIALVSPYPSHMSFWQFIMRHLILFGPRYFTLTALRVLLKKPIYSMSAWGKRYAIPLFKPRNVNAPSFLHTLAALKPDVIICSSPHLIRKKLLSLPRLGCINTHAGMLPRYRGIYPIFWALFNNEREIGLTTHVMNEGIDDGPIIVQRTIPIDPSLTFVSLLDKVVALTPPNVLDALKKLEDPTFTPQPNDSRYATYFTYPTLFDKLVFMRRKKKIF
jgi:methionyl-tRNA formyltransferase